MRLPPLALRSSVISPRLRPGGPTPRREGNGIEGKERSFLETINRGFVGIGEAKIQELLGWVRMFVKPIVCQLFLDTEASFSYIPFIAMGRSCIKRGSLSVL